VARDSGGPAVAAHAVVRLGAAALRTNSLREAMMRAMTSPLRRLRESGEVREEEAREL